MRPKITHVAVRFGGEIYSLPAPNRHHHVIQMIYDKFGDDVTDISGENQGFLDASGVYLIREEALISALENKQVKNENDIRAGQLFSEDVW